MNAKIEALIEQLKNTPTIDIELEWDGNEGKEDQELWLCGDQLSLVVRCYKRVKVTSATYLEPEEHEVQEKSADVDWSSIMVFFEDEIGQATLNNEEREAIEQAVLDIITF